MRVGGGGGGGGRGGRGKGRDTAIVFDQWELMFSYEPVTWPLF